MNKIWLRFIMALCIATAASVIFFTRVYLPRNSYQFIIAEQGTMKTSVFGIGEVSAKDIYPVSTQTGGMVIRLNVDQGAWVKKGEKLANIDPVDLPQQLDGAKIALQEAQLEARAAEDEVSALGAQQKLARVTYRRTAELLKQKLVAKADDDKARSELDHLTAQIRSAKVKVVTAKAEQQKTRANIHALEEKLKRFTITSPIDGFVISRDAQVGQTLTPSQPLLTVVDPATVWVEINIDEHISGTISLGQSTSITLRSHPDRKLPGKVSRIEAQSDPVTRERIVDILFDKTPKPFYLHERAEATIVTGMLHNIIKIPLKALVQKGRLTGVWIAKDSKAHFHEVKILATDSQFAAIRNIPRKTRIIIPDPNKKPLTEAARVRL